MTTEEENKLLMRVKRLEQCINDFKLYDSKRKKYIEQLKNENENWKKRCFKINDDFDNYIEVIESANGTTYNPKVKAYYNSFLEKIANLKRELKTSQELLNVKESIDKSKEDLLLEISSLKKKKLELHKEIECLKSDLKRSNSKIENLENELILEKSLK